MNAQEQIDKVRRLDAELLKARSELRATQKACQHNWNPIKYTPRIVEGYMSPGDPPGTMGVDWRGPSWIDRSTTPIWTRTCKTCLLEQTTQYVKQVKQAGHIAGTTITVDEPDFERWAR